ncbi:MAG: glycosyltransferase family 4 protein [Nitrococcus sp.]|nr:glycosyltransferase family 4 protein [Nitrococcus sp.]
MTPSSPRPYALVLTRNLPPLVGGMERLVWHIVDELRADYRVHVVAPVGSKPNLPPNVTASEVPLSPLTWFLLRTLFTVLWPALRLRPCMVLAGSGLTAPFAWLAARLTGARSIVYLHGLDIEAKQPLYRLFWRPFFRRFDLVLVNSRFTRQLAIDAQIAPQRISILPPGVELPETEKRAALRSDFRSKHGLGDAPIMLYVGRITARKGLAVFAQSIFPKVAGAIPTARLIVIGGEPANALLQSEKQRARIDRALTYAGLTDRALFLGKQDDAQVDAAYFAADVLIFPVQQSPGDNEGFGMVAVEAAAHGLPTVAFAAGGVADAVAEGISGRLITANDNEGFAQAVIEQLGNMTTAEQSAACARFAEDFAWPAFGERLRAYLRGCS